MAAVTSTGVEAVVEVAAAIATAAVVVALAMVMLVMVGVAVVLARLVVVVVTRRRPWLRSGRRRCVCVVMAHVKPFVHAATKPPGCVAKPSAVRPSIQAPIDASIHRNESLRPYSSSRLTDPSIHRDPSVYSEFFLSTLRSQLIHELVNHTYFV